MTNPEHIAKAMDAGYDAATRPKSPPFDPLAEETVEQANASLQADIDSEDDSWMDRMNADPPPYSQIVLKFEIVRMFNCPVCKTRAEALDKSDEYKKTHNVHWYTDMMMLQCAHCGTEFVRFPRSIMYKYTPNPGYEAPETIDPTGDFEL